jgi:WD40 repeat protein
MPRDEERHTNTDAAQHAKKSVHLDQEDSKQTPMPAPANDTTQTFGAARTVTEVRADAPPGYAILNELGRGGMGVVYLARQVKLNRLVALKMILAGGHAGTAELQRFATEAEAIARLHHPNIVQIYEVGENNGLPFFSLEYCAGGSLRQRLASTPLPINDTVRLVETLALAIHAAHTANVVHRDLKPANILLGKDDSGRINDETTASDAGAASSCIAHPASLQPKIADFGLARKLDEAGLTASNAVMGTPSYMAPEQASGKNQDVGPAVDVYALGAILYECLTGRPPFWAATSLDTLRQVIADEPVPPRKLQSQVSRDLETICLKCLHKEPSRRYASAAALADDLRRLQAAEPIRARPAGAFERGVKWVRRNPLLAALPTAVTATLLLGMTFSLVFALRAARERARAESARHAIQIEWALRAIEQHDLLEAERVVGAMDDQFQDTWEQRYVHGLMNRRYVRLPSHKYLANTDGITADGKRVVSLRANGDRVPVESFSLDIWDPDTGKQLLSPNPTVARLAGGTVAISPSGKRIAVACDKHPIKLLDGNNGTSILSLPIEAPRVSGIAFSADDQCVVSAGGDLSTQAPGELQVWDTVSGKLRFNLAGHTGHVNGVAMSANGSYIVSGGYDQTVKLWNARDGKLVRTLQGHQMAVYGVAIRADGKRIVSVGTRREKTKPAEGEVKIWDVDTGQALFTYHGQGALPRCVAMSADGKRFVTGGSDRIVKVWDGETGRDLFACLGHELDIFTVGISADGRRIVSRSGDQMRVWNVDMTPESLILQEADREDWSVHFSGDGRWIVSEHGDRTIVTWDAETGQYAKPPMLTWSGHGPAVKVSELARTALKGHSESILCAAISPDGKRIATGSADQTVKLWDSDTGQEKLALKGHTSPIRSLAFSPDGDRLVSGDYTTIRVWHAPRTP